MSIYEEELEGREFDWYAIDILGNLALFSTAGEGQIPNTVISCFEKHDDISESLGAPNWGSLEVWSDYSALGLYVYDWDLPEGPYKRVCVPLAEINNELKEKIIKVVGKNKLEVKFPETKEINLI